MYIYIYIKKNTQYGYVWNTGNHFWDLGRALKKCSFLGILPQAGSLSEVDLYVLVPTKRGWSSSHSEITSLVSIGWNQLEDSRPLGCSWHCFSLLFQNSLSVLNVTVDAFFLFSFSSLVDHSLLSRWITSLLFCIVLWN